MAVPVITVNLPTDEEEELRRRFTVNKNYLQAVSGFITTTYGRREKLYAGLRTTVEAMPQHQKIQRDPNVDLDEVRRFLTLAWTSEIQLHLPAVMGYSGMLAFANTWAPVHAYYAVYGALQAWFAANGMTGVADDHTATLKTIAKQIEQRDLFPEPWNLLATGCPMRGDRSYLNDHGHNCTGHIEVLSTPAAFGHDPEFWPRLGTWVRSTREARLTKREEQWKAKNNRKKIAPAERTRFAQNLAPTSLFDCFWRMRIKSNYGTIDPYLVNHISESEHQIYNRALCTVTRATVALLELFIMRRTGKAEFAKIATEFINQDTHNLSATMLRARLGAYGIATT
jgi:hypothetical protein